MPPIYRISEIWVHTTHLPFCSTLNTGSKMSWPARPLGGAGMGLGSSSWSQGLGFRNLIRMRLVEEAEAGSAGADDDW
jgi:hypothetical protein